jgi:WYL domain
LAADVETDGELSVCGARNLERVEASAAVERIRALAPTDHPYQMPLGFNVQEYVQDALNVMRGRRIDVELLFSRKAAAWIKDRI